MRKIRLIGLALLAVFAFGAVVASTASAELVTGGAPAFWLVKGEAPATGVEQGADIEGELELEHLTLASVLCSGLFEATIYNSAERGEGLITMVWSLSPQVLIELPTGLKCVSVKTCEAGDAELYPENLPWLVSLTLMTLDSEEKAAELFLILLSLDPVAEGGSGEPPAYEIDCLVAGFLIEELCFGETSAFLKLEGTSLIGSFVKEDQELEELEGQCGTSMSLVAVLEGTSPITLTSGEELMVSSTRGPGE